MLFGCRHALFVEFPPVESNFPNWLEVANLSPCIQSPELSTCLCGKVTQPQAHCVLELHLFVLLATSNGCKSALSFNCHCAQGMFARFNPEDKILFACNLGGLLDRDPVRAVPSSSFEAMYFLKNAGYKNVKYVQVSRKRASPDAAPAFPVIAGPKTSAQPKATMHNRVEAAISKGMLRHARLHILRTDDMRRRACAYNANHVPPHSVCLCEGQFSTCMSGRSSGWERSVPAWSVMKRGNAVLFVQLGSARV